VADCVVLTEESVSEILDTSGRSRSVDDAAFRIPWELKSFALGVAFYESGDFAWEEFQTELVAAIDQAVEQSQPEQYYARWVEALESLLSRRGGIDTDELDRRTREILDTPRDDTHQHAHPDPVSVESGHHHDDHDHDHRRGEHRVGV
jgi:nitrile hydratase accessory protein